MGFKVEGRTEIVLDFSDVPALTGLRVRCRSVSTAEAQRITALSVEEQRRALADDVILDWNFEDERGEKQPVTAGVLAAQEPWFEDSIRGAWFRGLYTPPSPLSESSRNGAS